MAERRAKEDPEPSRDRTELSLRQALRRADANVVAFRAVADSVRLQNKEQIQAVVDAMRVITARDRASFDSITAKIAELGELRVVVRTPSLSTAFADLDFPAPWIDSLRTSLRAASRTSLNSAEFSVKLPAYEFAEAARAVERATKSDEAQEAAAELASATEGYSPAQRRVALAAAVQLIGALLALAAILGQGKQFDAAAKIIEFAAAAAVWYQLTSTTDDE